MANYYVSWATGVDATGDGSAALPFKTITKATQVCSAGDFIRVAKSPANTAISGSWNWTNGSASVVCSGDKRAEVAAKDLIGNSTIEYWEISSVAYAGGNTTVTLRGKFYGTTGSQSIEKLGVTDTGAAAAYNTVIQEITKTGTAGNPITISGGWDLSIESLTGTTVFYQSGSSRYGYGLYAASSISFITLSNLRFARNQYHIYINGGSAAGTEATSWIWNDIKCYGSASYSVYVLRNKAWDVDNLTVIQSGAEAVYFSTGYGTGCGGHTIDNVTIKACTIDGSSGSGMTLYSQVGSIITNLSINGSYGNGLVIDGAYGNKFYNTTIDTCVGYGIKSFNTYAYRSTINNRFYTLTVKACQKDGIWIDVYSDIPYISSLTIQNQATAGYYGIHIDGGTKMVIDGLTASGNSTGGTIKIDNSNLRLYIRDFTSSDATKFTFPATTTYPGARVYSFSEDGTYNNHNITFANGVVSCVTAGVYADTYAWKFTPNASADSFYPVEIPVLVYPVINENVDIKLFVNLSNSAMTGRLLCRGGQVGGVASDVFIDAAASTGWQEVTLPLTPNEVGGCEIVFQVWGGNGTTDNVMIDAMTPPLVSTYSLEHSYHGPLNYIDDIKTRSLEVADWLGLMPFVALRYIPVPYVIAASTALSVGASIPSVLCKRVRSILLNVGVNIGTSRLAKIIRKINTGISLRAIQYKKYFTDIASALNLHINFTKGRAYEAICSTALTVGITASRLLNAIRNISLQIHPAVNSLRGFVRNILIALNIRVVTKPTCIIIINDDDETTDDIASILTISYSGGVTDMRLKNDDTAWGEWITPATSKNWALKAGADGTKTVYLQVRDTAGESDIANDSIELVTPSYPLTVIGEITDLVRA